MLNARQIDMLISRQLFGRLVDRILANGRCPDRSVRDALRQPRIARPVGLALALQRRCELAYRNDAAIDRIGDELLASQREDGWFTAADDGRPNVSATALAIRALYDWAVLRAAHPTTDEHDRSRDGRLRAALRCAVDALAAAQREDGLIDADLLGSLITLWQLGTIARCW
ncbi:MAG: hypothetical protein EA377_09125, partial [Phycisphaerales bacterium]